jgi:hypothetical protein
VAVHLTFFDILSNEPPPPSGTGEENPVKGIRRYDEQKTLLACQRKRLGKEDGVDRQIASRSDPPPLRVGHIRRRLELVIRDPRIARTRFPP